ncbi:beta-mannosidase [Mucilaginibacter achroorhodeus]|uniref:Mannan endo-1,4-beta-mannosidase n=1 Tax=Mucilaginibacter achroorhodeus TaxID=2599294 RepID=A0A563UAH1_9SPHI|nr:glycosyl hydrolase [Mucilaginibacter achroorhodeus]TWR28338.1 beta-mannosidase [Mucilaginibacter achroorhodeus]
MSLRFSICRQCFLLIITVFTTLWLPANAQLFNPSDPQATNETRQLYYSMQRLKGAGTIFGHHDDTAYGVGWCFVKDQSDVKSVTGTYPAIYGWDLAKIEHDSVRDINGVPFKYQKQLVQEAYRRGGINTFCWHMDNPANGKTAWDTSMRTVATILPGGEHHETYKQWLDKAAAYMANLNGDDGEQIPILFRPFHELTGNWFWWCANTSTPEEFKQLWRFTIDYLRQTRKLHNLLIVFSEADFNSEEEFMQRYPGNGYVDFIGFDNYCYKNVEDYKYNLNKRLDIIDGIAKRNNKLTCLPETGYEQIPQANWWTTVLQPILANHQPSYAMVWRNGRPDHYYAPYPGQISEADFKKFFASPQVIFENRIAPLGVYGKYVLKK